MEESMKIIRIVLLTTFLSFAALPVHAVILCYTTGSEYIEMDDNDRLAWLVGAMDGIMAESTMIKKDDNGPWLGRCINGLTIQQIKAMFEKELNENPEAWHGPAAFILRNKMQKFCKGKI
jgi:hypothetical protein|tara:strand:- start:137 stop:496 length:360 start_codon:yes stop_codon:yes gene_type:complete